MNQAQAQDSSHLPKLAGSARISTALQQFSGGHFALGFLFLILFVSSLGVYSSYPTYWAAAGMATGLLGLAGISGNWVWCCRSSLSVSGVPTIISVRDDETAITTAVTEPRQIFRLLRAAIQGRKPLPSPYGEVNGNPSKKESLKEYSPEERAQIMKEIEKGLSEHDATLLNRIKEVEEKAGELLLPQGTEPSSGQQQ